jgi:hypothetical protein
MNRRKFMDWDRVIEINRQALSRIVTELFATLRLVSGGRLAQPAYRALLRVLRPAESAVRRLIVIAARDLVVELPAGSPAARPLPKGPVRPARPATRMSFQLFDPRRNFSRVRRNPASKLVPRIRVIGYDPRIPMLHALPPPVIPPVLEQDGIVSVLRLQRRLAAIKAALEDLPGQAKRLARWKARRELLAYARFKSPLRPGRPPGFRSRPKHDVDHVLKECHSLAWSVTRGDTS